MEEYFVSGYVLKRYTEGVGPWSDGQGEWVAVSLIEGRMRQLSSSERVELGENVTTHRFYTKHKDIKHNDFIEKDNSFRVIAVDEKNMGDLDFMQIDCELVI